MTRSDIPVLVVGGGPAGLATSRELLRRAVEHLVLERGGAVGHTWENLYDSLTLHTGKHMSALPGRRFRRGTPLFPSRGHFLEYLREYAAVFRLPVRTGAGVTGARRADGGWQVDVGGETVSCRALVVATGIVANPVAPVLAGQPLFGGRVMHSVEYRRPEGFQGRRVLVVGVGNSGAEIAAELANSGVEVAVAVRSGANVVPLRLFGVPIQYAAFVVGKLPRPAREGVVAAVGKLTELRRGPPVLPRPAHSPLDRIPLIGFHLVDAIRAGKVRVHGAIAELTPGGARFAEGGEEPFDDVILATGFRAAVDFIDSVARRDARGFGRRRDRIASADHAGLFYVGHNYDATGALFNIARDARQVAERLARGLNGAGARRPLRGGGSEHRASSPALPGEP